MKYSLKTIFAALGLLCNVYVCTVAHKEWGTWWATAFWILSGFLALANFLEALIEDMKGAA